MKRRSASWRVFWPKRAPDVITTLKRVFLATGLASVASLLASCAEMHHGFQAVTRSTQSPIDAADEPVTRATKTPSAQTSQIGPDESFARVAAVPTPRQIFDFHPAGSGPDGWRQPFIIDLNDGPLASDVRRSAAELKAYNAGVRTFAQEVAHRPCSETDVASAKPGCVARAPKGERATGSVAVRDKSALQ